MSDLFPSHCEAEHPDANQALAANLLDARVATEVANLFKAMADPTRVRIMGLLAHAEVCVGDLVRVLAMSQPAISHQLRVLRNLRVVRARKSGRHVFYSLMDDHIRALFKQGVAHIEEG
jgi:ArsR family transcriptional regulator